MSPGPRPLPSAVFNNFLPGQLQNPASKKFQSQVDCVSVRLNPRRIYFAFLRSIRRRLLFTAFLRKALISPFFTYFHLHQTPVIIEYTEVYHFRFQNLTTLQSLSTD